MKKKLSLIALSTLFVFAALPFANATDDIQTPTLTRLNQKDSNLYPNPSAYKLNDISEKIADDLDTNGDYIGDDYSFVIKKYIENEDGSYTANYFDVEINDVALSDDSTSNIYYNWDNSTGNRYLTTTDSSGGSLTADNSDFFVDYSDDSVTNIRFINTATVAENINKSYINSNFTDSNSAEGGAIYNYGSITTPFLIGNITGNFIGNYAYSSSNTAQGGAIYNHYATIGNIIGDFINNYANTSKSTAKGGAIYNNYSTIGTITGDFVDNYAISTGTSSAYGGAIYNYKAQIGNITGDFIGNYVSTDYTGEIYTSGGAIYNESASYTNSTIGNITGDFIGNYATSKITTITNDNYAAKGGAISNYAAYAKAIIGDIDGNFISNYTSSEGYAYGGAISNRTVSSNGTATIGNITGDFFNNYATGTEYAYGGAICNKAVYSGNATIESITGDFIENYVCSDGEAAGGAIYNYSPASSVATIGYIEGNFIGNYAVGSTALGGAVYTKYASSASLTFKATDVDNVGTSYYYVGNWAGSSEENRSDANGGFMYMQSSSATFNVDALSSITIGDGTAGYDSIASYDETSVITKEGDGLLTVNSSMQNYSGTLNVEAGEMAVNNGLNASSISILTDATLSATISGNNTFSNSLLGSDGYTYYNAGTLKLIASATIESGTEYSIVASEYVTNLGNVITYGGSLSGTNFKVSDSSSFDISDQSETTVTDNGRIVIDTSSSSSSSVETVVMSFNSTSSTLTSITDVTTNLENAISIADDSKILAAFDFGITLETDESVVLSFLVGEGYNLSDFTVYHSTDNTNWDVASDISDLTYDGEYLSFIVNSFSAYGIEAVVPEPSTYAVIFAALALGLAIYRRRK